MATLANVHRLRVIAALSEGRNYVSQLARDLGISRPLLQAHLRRLEAVDLVSSTLELASTLGDEAGAAELSTMRTQLASLERVLTQIE